MIMTKIFQINFERSSGVLETELTSDIVKQEIEIRKTKIESAKQLLALEIEIMHLRNDRLMLELEMKLKQLSAIRRMYVKKKFVSL